MFVQTKLKKGCFFLQKKACLLKKQNKNVPALSAQKKKKTKRKKEHDVVQRIFYFFLHSRKNGRENGASQSSHRRPEKMFWSKELCGLKFGGVPKSAKLVNPVFTVQSSAHTSSQNLPTSRVHFLHSAGIIGGAESAFALFNPTVSGFLQGNNDIVPT